MAMMKRYLEAYRETGEELSHAYTGMEHDELVGRFLALRFKGEGSDERDLMLRYSVLKEFLRDPQFLEHEALGDHDLESLLRAFANEAGMDGSE